MSQTPLFDYHKNILRIDIKCKSFPIEHLPAHSAHIRTPACTRVPI